MPPEIRNIYGFALFNAFSFQVILGGPMILYAKTLEASSTTLGLIAGMTSLLVVLQIPAARHVDAVGYKRFVLSGWTVRTVFVALMALLPLTGAWLPSASQLALLIGLLFLFNLARGISSCGWLPWISSIIPPEVRGRHLTFEASTVNAGSFAVFWLAAWVLGGASPEPWRFAALFGFAAVCAALSLRFLQRIPETEVERLPPSAGPRLREMLAYPGFARLVSFNLLWSLACGGLATFIVAYLKEMEEWSEQRILGMMSLGFIGGLCNQWLLPGVLDKHGSKPAIFAAAGLCLLIAVGWTATAGGPPKDGWTLIALLLFGIGLASSMMNLANLRLVLLSAPESGRSHYFATISVISHLALGCAPVCWGILLDVWGSRVWEFAGLQWNRYTALFAGMLLAFVLAAVAACFLREPGGTDFRKLLDEAVSRRRLRYWLRSAFRVPPRG
jgi:MFS family permease